MGILINVVLGGSSHKLEYVINPTYPTYNQV